MMPRISTLLAALLMLAFATTVSAANVTCEGDPAGTCISPVAMPHCPMVPDKAMQSHLYCGSMCVAIAPSAHSVGAPVLIDVMAAQLPSSALVSLNDQPEPPPPRA